MPNMRPKVSEILGKKLVVVTGKGGSGKSLIALSLAHRLSKEGKKVWLVEMGRKRDQAFTRLPGLVGVKAAGHKPTEIELPESGEKVLLSVLDPAESLAEYVNLKLPTAGLAGLLLNNRVTASFLEVVPGLPDLVTLGKLWHALTHPKAKEKVDIVVLDAPASGHAVALLRAPRNFRRITKVGPIFRDAGAMVDFLTDPEKTALVLTTLPEEMSLKETEELKIHLKEFPSPFVFVNRQFPALQKVEYKENLPHRAYEYSRARAQREKAAVAAMPDAPALSIPYFFPDPAAPPVYLRISNAL